MYVFTIFKTSGQTCIITNPGPINWTSPTDLACADGVDPATAAVLVIPAGVTVNFDDNGDTWSGVRIEVFGTMNITAAGQITINSSIVVKSGGLLAIGSKLNLGAAAGCGYTLAVESGGTVDITSSTADRLSICGEEIARGGTAGCNPYPEGPTPYCEPSTGFTGPTGFDEDGYNGTLPVQLIRFSLSKIDNASVLLSWSTATEKDSKYFVIERSGNGQDFYEIGQKQGSGTSGARIDYSFVDGYALVGRSYYRLRQVDFDGTTAYYGPRFIDIQGKRSLSVYPNPVRDHNLNLLLNFSSEEMAHATIYDLSGLELANFSFSGPNHLEPVKLLSGSYLLRVRTGTESYMTRFIVQ
jgi:hypothetical protein